MNKYTIYIAIFACILCASYAIESDGTWCKVNKEFENTKIFTSVGETQDYDLDNYFQGYNLKYDFSVSGAESKYYSIVQGVDFRNEPGSYDDEDDEKIPLGASFYQDKSDSEGHFAELTKNLKNEYVVKFGSAQKTLPPFLKKKVVLPKISNEICLDITLVRDDVGIVDCVQFVGATAKHYYNHYYVISASEDHQIESIRSNTSYLNFMPLKRKNMRYETTHDGITQIYLIQGVSYDLQDGDPYTTYLNIFRYVVDRPEVEGWHNGHLQVNAPIVGAKLEFNNFKLSDFDVLGEWIYVLDQTQGVTFFRYKSNELVDVKKHSLTKSAVRRFGINVTMIGSRISLLVAEPYQIVEYMMPNLDDDPQFVEVYRLENQNMATVGLQSTQNHIVLSQGRLLTIFDRGVTNIDYTKAQIQNASLSYLWYSDNLYIFNGLTVKNYMLSYPVLRVAPKKASSDGIITITATSSNFENTSTCSIDLISVTIEKANSKSAYYTNFPADIEWNEQTSFATILPLGVYWVGPNIKYNEKLKESKKFQESKYRLLEDANEFQKAFLAKKETGHLPAMYGDSNVLYIDEPKRVNLTIETEDDPDWFFTRVIPIPGDIEGSFYSVHQDSKYDVYIYVCVPPVLLLTEVYCGNHIAKIELGTKVVSMDYGTWGHEEDILAIVKEDHRGFVEFYYLQYGSGEEPGELWFREDFNSKALGFSNKIQSITLQNDSLYVVLENGTERFVAITAYDEFLQVRDIIRSADVADWPSIPMSEGWYPEKVIVSDHHPNVIFIKSRTQIFIASVSTHQALFLNYVKIDTEINTEIFVNQKALVVAQANNKIIDYSLQNINWVSMREEFQYQVYDFEFTDIFAIDVGKKSGLIYVLARTLNKKDLNLLIYRSGVENIRTLFKVIPIETEDIEIDNSKPFTVNAGGDTEDFIFVQYNGQKKYFRAPTEDKIILISRNQDKSQYVDIVEIIIEMTAWDNKVHEIVHDVTLVNGQTSIIPNHEAIKESVPEAVYANNKEHAEFPVNVKGWWNGSVVGLELTCSPDPDVCGDQITITNIVQEKPDEEEQLSKRTKVIDMHTVYDKIYQLYQLPDSQDYAIGYVSNKLEVSDKDYNTVTSKNGDYLCQFLLPVYDDSNGELKHFVVICFSGELSRYVSQIIYPKGDDNDGEYPIAKFSKIQEGSLKKDQFQVFHEYLFVNAQGKSAFDGLYIFDLYNPHMTKIEGVVSYSNNQVNFIDQYTFSGQAPNLSISSFFITYERIAYKKDEEKYIKLILADSPTQTDYQPNLWFLDLELENNLDVVRNKIQKLEYDQFVLNHNLFVNEDTRILKLHNVSVLERVIGKMDYIDYTFIIMTDNTALYEVSLVFEVSTEHILEPLQIDLNLCQILNVYNNYGIAKPYPFLSIEQNTLAVAYYNQYNKDTTIALYELSNVKQRTFNKRAKADQVPLHTMQGGHKYESTFSFIGASYPFYVFALYHNPDLDYPSLITTDFKGDFALMAFDYTPNTVVIETNGKFDEQSVSVNMISDYNSQYNVFGLDVSPGSFKPKDEGGSGDGWIIAVSVIGGLLLLGGVGYFIWRKRQQRGGYGSLKPSYTEQSSDAGYSLQEPTKA